MNKKEKMIPKTINFTPRLIEMVDEIKQREGLNDFTSVVHSCIGFKHTKLFPQYVALRGSLNASIPGDPRTPEEKAKAKVAFQLAQKKAEDDAKFAKKADICVHILKGKVIEEGGYRYCIFQSHDREGSYDQKLPLLQVDPVIAQNLFSPSKEAVLEARPGLRRKYGDKMEDLSENSPS